MGMQPKRTTRTTDRNVCVIGLQPFDNLYIAIRCQISIAYEIAPIIKAPVRYLNLPELFLRKLWPVWLRICGDPCPRVRHSLRHDPPAARHCYQNEPNISLALLYDSTKLQAVGLSRFAVP